MPKKLARRRLRFEEIEIERALRRGFGNYQIAGELLDCSEHTVRKYVKRSERLQRVHEEMRLSVMERAKSVLTQCVYGRLSGSDTKDMLGASKFVMTHSPEAREEGWGKSEKVIDGEAREISVSVNVHQLSIRELEKLDEAYNQAARRTIEHK